MSRCRVIVWPPSGAGGRRVGIAGPMPSAVFSAQVLTVFAQFAQNACLTGWDVLGVVESGRTEWGAGGPEVWRL
jgi:hypothetical protein